MRGSRNPLMVSNRRVVCDHATSLKSPATIQTASGSSATMSAVRMSSASRMRLWCRPSSSGRSSPGGVGCRPMKRIGLSSGVMSVAWMDGRSSLTRKRTSPSRKGRRDQNAMPRPSSLISSMRYGKIALTSWRASNHAWSISMRSMASAPCWASSNAEVSLTGFLKSMLATIRRRLGSSPVSSEWAQTGVYRRTCHPCHSTTRRDAVRMMRPSRRCAGLAMIQRLNTSGTMPRTRN